MTKNYCKELWEGFAVELNSLGPPTRTSPEWQRVWIHYKANIKKKLANNKKNTQTTGGGSSQEIPLNSLEDCVSQLLSLGEQVAPAGETFGLKNIAPTLANDPVELNQSTAPLAEVSFNVPTKRRSRNSPEQERLELLRKQAETQAALLKTLKSIEKTAYENYEVNKQVLKLKQRKIALYEGQISKANELQNLKIECEKLKIEKLRKEMMH